MQQARDLRLVGVLKSRTESNETQLGNQPRLAPAVPFAVQKGEQQDEFLART
jgi:hypothetical protein